MIWLLAIGRSVLAVASATAVPVHTTVPTPLSTSTAAVADVPIFVSPTPFPTEVPTLTPTAVPETDPETAVVASINGEVAIQKNGEWLNGEW